MQILGIYLLRYFGIFKVFMEIVQIVLSDFSAHIEESWKNLSDPLVFCTCKAKFSLK
jgi:hypothetical protein